MHVMVGLLNSKPAHKSKYYPVHKDITDLGRWEISMLTFIEETPLYFRPCFFRKTAFGWAVTIIIGLMVRSAMIGITSALDSVLYNNMGHFSVQTPGNRKTSSLHKTRTFPDMRLQNRYPAGHSCPVTG